MQMTFSKMHGLGNDFVVLDFTQQSIQLSASQVQQIADRHTGVGCDQILIVENSDRDDIDFRYRILNADGSEVGQCGNGARCFVRYVHEKGLSSKNPLKVETLSGDMVLNAIADSNLVEVNMGQPRFAPNQIPLAVEQEMPNYQLHLEQGDIEFSALSMGNPHAVIMVENVCTAPVQELGPVLESHAVFPERANIGFMEIRNRQEIALRVFERGVGETIACGSGACAAVVAGIQAGKLDSQVTAYLNGGPLHIVWQGEDAPVMMTGPAEFSFEGSIAL